VISQCMRFRVAWMGVLRHWVEAVKRWRELVGELGGAGGRIGLGQWGTSVTVSHVKTGRGYFFDRTNSFPEWRENPIYRESRNE